VSSLYHNVQKLSRLRSRLLVISWPHRRPLDELDSRNRELTRMRLRGIFYRGPILLDLMRFLILAPLELWEFHKFVRRHNVQVVNYHFIHAVAFTLAAARCLGLYKGGLIFSIHGLDLRTLVELRGIRRALIRWALNRADAVVACSEDLAKEAVHKLGLRSEIVQTIHNGVGIQRLKGEAASSTREIVSSRDGPIFLNLGTFEFKKGHDVLIRAFVEVLRVHPTACLFILGRAGPESEATAQLVKTLQLEGSVFLLADVLHKDALAALQAADIFVLSSRNEAFSVALLEAGSFRKPVVATSVCGVEELIENNVSGLIAPPESPTALADAMLSIAADPARASMFGRKLFEVIEADFTEEQCASRYLRLVAAQESDSGLSR